FIASLENPCLLGTWAAPFPPETRAAQAVEGNLVLLGLPYQNGTGTGGSHGDLPVRVEPAQGSFHEQIQGKEGLKFATQQIQQVPGWTTVRPGVRDLAHAPQIGQPVGQQASRQAMSRYVGHEHPQESVIPAVDAYPIAPHGLARLEVGLDLKSGTVGHGFG